jgi:hypothetical protein
MTIGDARRIRRDEERGPYTLSVIQYARHGYAGSVLAFDANVGVVRFRLTHSDSASKSKLRLTAHLFTLHTDLSSR